MASARPGRYTAADGPADDLEPRAFFVAALRAAVPRLRLPAARVPSRKRVRASMDAAGFRRVHVETVSEGLEFRSADQLWEWVIDRDPVVARAVASLTEADRALVRAVLDGMLRERSGGRGGAVFTNRVILGVGAM